MSLVHNERVKLTASCINTLATTTVAAGVIAPLAALVFGLPATGAVSTGVFAAAVAAWLVLGAGLTFASEAFAWETAVMSAFELYALFGSPILLLAWALAIVWLTRLQDEREDRRQTPAE